jgi:DNA-directed RNA polymerase subunit K/omega
MTPFELAALIGERAEMISRGAKIHPKYAGYPTVDLIKIATLEIEDPTIPFPLMLKRPIDHPTHPTIVEIFKVRELLTPSQRLTNHIVKYTPVSNWRVFD